MTDTTAYPAPSLRSAPGESGVRRITRACFRPLAHVFALSLVMQFFLAGWALFMNPGAWMWHRSAAMAPTLLAVLLVATALAGRVVAWRRWLAVAALVLTLVLGATANIRGIPGAFHPVTALVLVAVALRLLHRAPSSLVRDRKTVCWMIPTRRPVRRGRRRRHGGRHRPYLLVVRGNRPQPPVRGHPEAGRPQPHRGRTCCGAGGVAVKRGIDPRVEIAGRRSTCMQKDDFGGRRGPIPGRPDHPPTAEQRRCAS